MTETIRYDEEGRLRDLLLGHSVKKINDDRLQLDDGTMIRVVPNDGGCACGDGDYELTDLNEVDNIITSVSAETSPERDEDRWPEGPHTYRVFVVAGDKRINLLTVEGSDGDGYYGTGYVISVRGPE